jgi:hypothetical protein
MISLEAIEANEPVFINGKHYSGLRRMTLSKLEHLLQLANDEVQRYARLKPSVNDIHERHLRLLRRRVSYIQQHIDERHEAE